MADKENEILWREYFYPGGNVLVNNLGIKDFNKLKEAEATCSFERLLELRQKELDMDINKDRLNFIHKYIFEDIYPFAGKYRKVNIKGFLEVDKSEDIDGYLDRLFVETNNMLRDCDDKDSFSKVLAELYTRLIHIHPYRVGNRRTIREFLREYSIKKSEELKIGKMELDWTLIDTEELDKNNSSSYVTEEFRNALVPKEKIRVR